jgi:hypothetical protein
MDFLPEITIPIASFLILYGVYVLFYLLYALFNIYHLLRFATATPMSYVITFVFGVGSIGLLAISLLLLSRYDWSVPFSITAIFEGPEGGSSLFKL